MKHLSTFILFFLISFSNSIQAQNQPPVLSITTILVDTVAETIAVTYDVQDADNDPLEILVGLSTDSGTTHLETNFFLSGDIGFPVSPGTNKNMVINYNGQVLHSRNGPTIWSTIKITATDRKPVDLQPIIDQIDSAAIYNHLLFFSQPRHHQTAAGGLMAVKDTIVSGFHAAQLQVERLPFNFGTNAAENLKGRKPGLVSEEKVIVLDGHFDAVSNTPGADDNATALVSLMAGVAFLKNLHFEKTINYLAFDKEEQGLVGAIHYVTNSILPFEEIEAVINGEMLGYYDSTANSQQVPQGFNIVFPAAVDSIMASGNRGIFLFVIGNTTNSAQLSVVFDSIARHYVPSIRSLVLNAPGTGALTPDLRRSDHAAFWDAGIPALMLTDGADTRNPYYHTLADSVGTLNMNYLVKNVKAMVANVAALATPLSAGVDQSTPFLLSNANVVSSESHQKVPTVELFPVPSNGRVYLRFEQSASNVIIKITTPEGKHVFEQQQPVFAGEQYQIDLGASANLVHGLLLVEIVIDKTHVHKKLLMHPPHQH